MISRLQALPVYLRKSYAFPWNFRTLEASTPAAKPRIDWTDGRKSRAFPQIERHEPRRRASRQISPCDNPRNAKAANGAQP